MSEANKELAKLWFEEVWNKGRREAIRELLATDALIHDATDTRKGTEGFYTFFDRMRSTFSDIHVIVQETLAEGDKVCLRWSCSMQHAGSGLGMPATHKKIHATGITIVQIANGKFVAVWQNWDMLGILQQIGDQPKSPTYLGTSPSTKTLPS